jgi:hypothetical protein
MPHARKRDPALDPKHWLSERRVRLPDQMTLAIFHLTLG